MYCYYDASIVLDVVVEGHVDLEEAREVEEEVQEKDEGETRKQEEDGERENELAASNLVELRGQQPTTAIDLSVKRVETEEAKVEEEEDKQAKEPSTVQEEVVAASHSNRPSQPHSQQHTPLATSGAASGVGTPRERTPLPNTQVR